MKNIDNLPKSFDYIEFLTDLKGRIHASQMRAALAANSELISLYWHIGKSIIRLQKEKGWGNAVVEQLSSDLKKDYPGVSGFSRTNLFAMRQMYLFFSPTSEFVPQVVGQLPWAIYALFSLKLKINPLLNFI